MKESRWIRFRFIALAYLICITIAFLLPGSALPKQNWFAAIYLDKWIHVILFAGLVIAWSLGFSSSPKASMIIFLLAVLYGILIEFAQELFIKNRSLDFFDILADLAGSILGYTLVRGYIKK